MQSEIKTGREGVMGNNRMYPHPIVDRAKEHNLPFNTKNSIPVTWPFQKQQPWILPNLDEDISCIFANHMFICVQEHWPA